VNVAPRCSSRFRCAGRRLRASPHPRPPFTRLNGVHKKRLVSSPGPPPRPPLHKERARLASVRDKNLHEGYYDPSGPTPAFHQPASTLPGCSTRLSSPESTSEFAATPSVTLSCMMMASSPSLASFVSFSLSSPRWARPMVAVCHRTASLRSHEFLRGSPAPTSSSEASRPLPSDNSGQTTARKHPIRTMSKNRNVVA
jgi:hypothetical protein